MFAVQQNIEYTEPRQKKIRHDSATKPRDNHEEMKEEAVEFKCDVATEEDVSENEEECIDSLMFDDMAVSALDFNSQSESVIDSQSEADTSEFEVIQSPMTIKKKRVRQELEADQVVETAKGPDQPSNEGFPYP